MHCIIYTCQYLKCRYQDHGPGRVRCLGGYGAVDSIDLWKLTLVPGRFSPSPFSHCSCSLQLFTPTPSSSLSHAFSRVNTFLPANLPPFFCLCSLFSSCFCLFTPLHLFRLYCVVSLSLYICVLSLFFLTCLLIPLIHRHPPNPSPSLHHPVCQLCRLAPLRPGWCRFLSTLT